MHRTKEKATRGFIGRNCFEFTRKKQRTIGKIISTKFRVASKIDNNLAYLSSAQIKLYEEPNTRVSKRVYLDEMIEKTQNNDAYKPILI